MSLSWSTWLILLTWPTSAVSSGNLGNSGNPESLGRTRRENGKSWQPRKPRPALSVVLAIEPTSAILNKNFSNLEKNGNFGILVNLGPQPRPAISDGKIGRQSRMEFLAILASLTVMETLAIFWIPATSRILANSLILAIVAILALVAVLQLWHF